MFCRVIGYPIQYESQFHILQYKQKQKESRTNYSTMTISS